MVAPAPITAASNEARLHRWVLAAFGGGALAALHTTRTADLYLASAAGAASWAPLTGAAIGAAWARLRPHASAPWAFLVAAVATAACSSVPFAAFGAPLAREAAFACVIVATASLTVALIRTGRGHARWSWAMGLVTYAVHPLRVAAVAAIGLAAEYLSAQGGHLRTGPGLALWLALVAVTYAGPFEYLEGRPLPERRGAAAAGCGALFLAAVALLHAEWHLPLAELDVYSGEIVHARWGASHRYVVVAVPSGHELFEDAVLVASPLDGLRHGAALAGSVPVAGGPPRRALLLFGGTGIVERALLSRADVSELTVVVADPELPRVAAGLRWIDRGPPDGRVRVVEAEPLPWLQAQATQYDLVVANLPPPLEYRAGKYYTRHFFALVAERLAEGGVVTFPAASAFSARAAFEDVVATARAAGLDVAPRHAALSAFGPSSFVVGARSSIPRAAVAGDDAGGDLAPAWTGRVSRLHEQHVVDALTASPPPLASK